MINPLPRPGRGAVAAEKAERDIVVHGADLAA
jgi:hypothetical protein